MGYCTYATCPITGDVFIFGEGSRKDCGQFYADTYRELALRHLISFREIWMLYLVAQYGPEAYDMKFDLNKKLQEIEWETQQDLHLART